MSESKSGGDVPPDLPPEYAEAYLRGYERAVREASGGGPDEVPDEVPDEGPDEIPDEISDEVDVEVDDAIPEQDDAEHTTVFSPLHDVFESAATRAAEAREAREARAAEAQDPVSHRRTSDWARTRPQWFVPTMLGVLALVLLLSAYGIGKVFSDSVSGADVSAPKSNGELIPSDGGVPKQTHAPQGKKYDGRTEVAPIGSAKASCTSPNGVDAGGHKVSYEAGNIYDGDLTTAWRCNGSGIGQQLTIDLPDRTEIGEVGLIPGYAKTDPRDGVNRYAQNNRITRVRWTFGDGTSLEQKLDGSPKLRDMQSIRIPRTTADRVVLDILASTKGSRNTVAISEVRLGAIPH